MNPQLFKKQMIDREISNSISRIESKIKDNVNDLAFAVEQMEFIIQYFSSVLHVKVDPSKLSNLTHSKPASSWTTPEKVRISKRVENWTPENSEAWRQLQNIYGDRVQLRLLLDIAEKLSEQCNIPLDRDAKRRKIILIKWFEEHWAELSPLVGNWSISQGKIHRLNPVEEK